MQGVSGTRSFEHAFNPHMTFLTFLGRLQASSQRLGIVLMQGLEWMRDREVKGDALDGSVLKLHPKCGL